MDSSINGSQAARTGVPANAADRATSSVLRAHGARSAVFFGAMTFFFVLWMVGLTMTSMSAMSMVGVHAMDIGGSGGAQTLSLAGLGGLLIVGVAWFVSLVVPVREFLGGQGTMLEDAAARGGPIYDAIRERIERYAPAVAVVEQSIEGARGIEVRGGGTWAMVLVRPFGPNLHVEWTMWRNRSTARLVSQVLSEMVEGSRAGDAQLVASSSSSAMREALVDAVSAQVGS